MKRQIRRRILDQRGFTLVEALVALVISLILGAGLYFTYNHQHRQYLAEQNVSELQGNARFIIDSLGRDLIMAGYRPVTMPGISYAADNMITFEYWDDRAEVTGTYDKHRQITFSIDTTNTKRPLKRKAEKYNGATSAYEALSNEVIGEHVESMQFQYYDNTNQVIAAPLNNPVEIKRIKSIKVTVRVRSVDRDPLLSPPQYKYMTLTGTYQARNLGIAENPKDETPPDPPQTVLAVDPQVCGQLTVYWSPVSAPDLAGYYVFLGQESGAYVRKQIQVSPAMEEGFATYTFNDLTSTRLGDSVPVTYYVAVAAFDRSANMSSLSAEAVGNPPGNYTTLTEALGAGGSDTTLNPVIPSKPEIFEARDGLDNQGVPEAGANPGEVHLTWTASTSPDIMEYRLHRSTTPGFAPDGEEAGQGSCIAVLDPAAVSYTDGGLIGCTVFYYKLAAVNCDETLVSTYAETDYSYCYGDGGGPGPDSPTDGVTDSSPYDTTAIDNIPYPVPQISSIPGWRRVFLNLTNPNFTDDPDFDRTEIYWNKGAVDGPENFPSFATDTEGHSSCTVATGSLVADSSGVFTSPGGGTNFIHDSEQVEQPSEPLLDDEIIYYYLAVSYDKCGNCTSATEQARTLANLCGDDPLGLPQCSPSLFLTTQAEGCGDYVHLAWNGDCLKEGTDLNWDFSGFHLYRNEGPTYNPSDPTHVELTGGTPQWYQTYTDAAMVEGTTYSYAVTWADCAWEHQNGGNISDPWGNGGLFENVSIGRIDSDDNGTVLTGDLNSLPPSFEHNVVRFFIKNTSAGMMTISSIFLRWQNPLAYLKQVVVGDGNATPREVVYLDAGLNLSMGNTGGTLTMAKGIYGLDVEVPVELHFATSSGVVNENSDMREDLVEISVTYTNQTTGSTTCAKSGQIPVPLGPVASRVTQDRPSAATTAWSVPGYAGTNPIDQVVVPANVPVTVNAFVNDFSGVGIQDVTLYYAVDYGGTMTHAPVFNGFNYIAVPMTFVSGNLWKLQSPTAENPTASDDRIPAYNDASIWYFILARDSDGNFDREPEARAGAFQYYQQEADVCSNTPEPPYLEGYTYGTGEVELWWWGPYYNLDGSECIDLEGYRVYRSDGSSWSLLADIADPYVNYFYDAPPNVESVNYSYYVTAYDRCQPTIEGPRSSIFAECVGAPPCLLSASIVNKNPDESFYPGDAFDISLTVCSRAWNGWYYEYLYVQSCSGDGDADPVLMAEVGDSGNFAIEPTYTLNPETGLYEFQSIVRTYLPEDYPPPGGADYLDLRVANFDYITVGGFNDYGYSDSTCQNSFECARVTIPVYGDPCLNPQPPGPPQNLAAASAANCNAANPTVSLSWNPPPPDMTGFPIPVTGFNIYRCQGLDCTPYYDGAVPVVTNLAATTYVDNPPAKLINSFRYAVTAVNGACETMIMESPPSATAQATCF